MGAVKKYQKYVTENDPTKDKKEIEQYVKKMQVQITKDPALQKKAAQILEQMINSKHKK
jgi:hypothetical protein